MGCLLECSLCYKGGVCFSLLSCAGPFPSVPSPIEYLYAFSPSFRFYFKNSSRDCHHYPDVITNLHLHPRPRVMEGSDYIHSMILLFFFFGDIFKSHCLYFPKEDCVNETFLFVYSPSLQVLAFSLVVLDFFICVPNIINHPNFKFPFVFFWRTLILSPTNFASALISSFNLVTLFVEVFINILSIYAVSTVLVPERW